MIPRSIRGRLICGVTGTAFILLLVSGWLNYSRTRRATFEQMSPRNWRASPVSRACW